MSLLFTWNRLSELTFLPHSTLSNWMRSTVNFCSELQIHRMRSFAINKSNFPINIQISQFAVAAKRWDYIFGPKDFRRRPLCAPYWAFFCCWQRRVRLPYERMNDGMDKLWIIDLVTLLNLRNSCAQMPSPSPFVSEKKLIHLTFGWCSQFLAFAFEHNYRRRKKGTKLWTMSDACGSRATKK